MNLKYEKVTKSGATVTVYGFLTFEGNRVMRVDHFHDSNKIGIKVPLDVEMKITYPDAEEIKHIGRISDGRVNATKEVKLNIAAFKSLVENFEIYGYDYIFTFQLNAL
jgi:hypothetical protein